MPKEFTITITDLDIDGRGIGRLPDGLTIFIPGLLPGEVAKARVRETFPRYAIGEVSQIEKVSPDRIVPPCPLYGRCGGCNLQHLSYEGQLRAKRQQVVSALTRIGGLTDVEVQDCVPSPKTLRYRNHAQFMVDGEAIGFYADKSHEVVDGDKCLIVSEITDAIRAASRPAPQTLKQLIVRNGDNTPDIMTIWQVDSLAKTKPTIPAGVDSFWLHEAKQRNARLRSKWEHVAGSQTISEIINGIRYRISPAAFFQVNSGQTANLYRLVEELADLKGTETVLDLYCGSGTIGLALAKAASRIVGIDIIPASIEDANFNAGENGYAEKCEYHVGAVEKVLPPLVKRGLRADVVIVDPPRKGCDAKLLETVIELAPEKFIYVSCNPGTLARDLKVLKDSFTVEQVIPVDMFPQTMHVETVVLMSRVENQV